MSENSAPSYLVRDLQGNVYGPADAGTLRQWVGQGRIVAGMHLAARDTGDWIEVSVHPELADLFQGPHAAQPVAPSPVPTVSQTPAASPAPAAYPVTPVAEAVGMPVSYAPVQLQAVNIPGMISFITGLVGMISLFMFCVPICGCPIGGVMSLAAIVLGGLALQQIKANPVLYTGRGFAVAGLTMGIIVLLVYSAVVVVLVISAVRHP